MGAHHKGEKKLLKCTGDKLGVRENEQERVRLEGAPVPQAGDSAVAHGDTCTGDTPARAARFARGCVSSLPCDVSIPGTQLHPRIAPVLVSQALAGGARSRRAHGPGVALGWGHQFCVTRGSGGRWELLTQHHCCLSPAAGFPKISSSVVPIPALQLDPEPPSATLGHPVTHRPWGRSSPWGPVLPQHPNFTMLFSTTTVGQVHKDMRTQLLPSLPARTRLPLVFAHRGTWHG